MLNLLNTIKGWNHDKQKIFWRRTYKIPDQTYFHSKYEKNIFL